MKDKILKKTTLIEWYKHGLWTVAMIRNAVIKGVITEEDYKEITGEEY